MNTKEFEYYGDVIPISALGTIFDIAAGSAAVALAAAKSPQLQGLRRAAFPKQPDWCHPIPPERAAQFIAAAKPLELLHLSDKQQAIGRLIVGSVVLFEPATAEDMAGMLGTTSDTAQTTLSILTGRGDSSALTAMCSKTTPLIAEITQPNGDIQYGMSEALSWLSEEPGRSTIIDRSVTEAEIFFSDSL